MAGAPARPPEPLRWVSSSREPAFARFSEWFGRYAEAAPEARADLEEQGIALARQRRAELKRLIETDPKQALDLAVPVSVRRALPQSVTGLLEKRVGGRGNLAVFGVLAEPGREEEVTPTFRRAQFPDVEYKAYVYGRRLGEPTRNRVSLHGIAVDNALAVHENPARLLESEEATEQAALAAEAVCSVSGQPAAAQGEETPVEVGGEVFFVCGKLHLDELNRQLIAAEATDALGATGISSEQAVASAYTEGVKKLLLIRVDFSDLASSTVASNTAVSLITSLNNFYSESSYGKTSFVLSGAGSAVTPVLRMPRTAADYGGSDDFNGLRSDAQKAAATAGYVVSHFDFDVICMGAVPGFNWSGLGYVGQPGAWLHNSFSAGVAGHELGHNFGLNHASSWDTAGRSIIGAGTHVEYGDPFDTMGAANAGNSHFNARYKNYLNWLTSADRITVVSNGTYRIFAHDSANATGVRGLRIVRSSTTNYWVEFRQKFTANKWLMSGVGLRWAGNGNENSHLLDTTPGSADGWDDSPLLIGRTFMDQGGQIYITPVGKGGTQPESMDVTVNLGPFPTNLPPAVQLTASTTNSSPGATVIFQTSSIDPNGDALAYAWDFGDGTLGVNKASLSHSWSAVGDYWVRCTATDMKGGLATAAVLVRVGTPSTFRISGQVKTDGLPAEGVRVYVSGIKLTYTDSDGYYVLAGLTSGSYAVSASLDGYAFLPLFANPVALGPHAVDIDFFGASTEDQSASLVGSGSVWKYRDNGSNLGTSWIKPDFDDSLWKEGPAQLGYGDADEKTTVSYGSNANNKYITTYFRDRFAVADPATYTNLTVNLLRDDGAVVYLNGVEVFRSNMPATGAILYSTLASATVGGGDESAVYSHTVDVRLLRPGDNLLAVEVHQSSNRSSDISFDLGLEGRRYLRPIVVLAFPRDGAIFPAPFTVPIQANVADFDGAVSKVEFYADGQKLGEDIASPFTWSWRRAETGRATVTAVATDNDGLMSTSAPVMVVFQTPVVPAGSIWSYLDDGSNQRTAWSGIGFDDSLWKSGPAELGYGDASEGRPEATLVKYGLNANSKFITTYFRHAFDVAHPEQFTSLTLGLQRDDGALVYLNGHPVLKDNLPDTSILFTTLAVRAVNGVEETIFLQAAVDPALLVLGKNVLAVEVHQATANSSDLSFDLYLSGAVDPGNIIPTLNWTWAGAEIFFSWPASAVGWGLYETWDLTSPVAWSPVANPVSLSGDLNVVRITADRDRRFYSLRKR